MGPHRWATAAGSGSVGDAEASLDDGSNIRLEVRLDSYNLVKMNEQVKTLATCYHVTNQSHSRNRTRRME